MPVVKLLININKIFFLDPPAAGLSETRQSGTEAIQQRETEGHFSGIM